MGLDRSLPERYVIYLKNLLTGDMGTSFVTKRPVSTDLMSRLPATMELVLSAMILGSVVGILLGILAAYYRDSAIDHVARLLRCWDHLCPSSGWGLPFSSSFQCSLSCYPDLGGWTHAWRRRPQLRVS